MIRGKRIGRHYIGVCTAGPHTTILCSDKGTYCLLHRLLRRRA